MLSICGQGGFSQENMNLFKTWTERPFDDSTLGGKAQH